MDLPAPYEELEKMTREEIIEVFMTKKGFTFEKAESFTAIFLGEAEGYFD